MGLLEQLVEDQKTAMKAGDSNKLSTIRMLRSAIKNAEIENRKGDSRDALTEEQAQNVLAKQIKQRRESIEEYHKAAREDLVAQEQSELDILLTYAPQQLSAAELEPIVREIVTKIGVNSPRDMGKVMPAILAQVKGRADGRLVNQVVQKVLAEGKA